MTILEIVIAITIFVFLGGFIAYIFNLIGFVLPTLFITLFSIIFFILIIRFIIGR